MIDAKRAHPTTLALNALARGEEDEALAILQRALTARPDVGLWLSYAGLLRRAGKYSDALEAVQSALSLDPRSFTALLMKASLLEASGAPPPAVGRLYGLAIALAPPSQSLDPATRRALQHGSEVFAKYMRDFQGFLDQHTTDFPQQSASRQFLQRVSGRSHPYEQRPTEHHFPATRTIEFYDREEFPWLSAFEGYYEAILEELKAYLENSPKLFQPYVQLPNGVPLDQWAELNNSSNWSSLHLLKGEHVQAELAERFPKTFEALRLLPQPKVPMRSPAAMFSALRPRTHIPPHHGVSNTRLVLHLPLIVPPDCAFRVGSQTREWRPGQAWVFNDTIDHEAWNNSSQDRIILIADIWNPDLTQGDREAYARVVGLIDAYHGDMAASTPQL